MTDVQRNAEAGKSKTLNTVWHGAFAFVLQPDGIVVLTPKLSQHAHYAGAWEIGGLQKLAEGVHYELKGVQAAAEPACFDKKYNIIVESAVAGDAAELTQSTWKLPHPKEIATLQRVLVEHGNFTGTIPGEVSVPHEFGAVQVLTFDLSGQVPFVEGLPDWAPEPGEIVNLHVFAEETHYWSPASVVKHPTYEFENLLSLTEVGRDSNLDFDYTPGEIPLVEPSTKVPEGLRRRELVSLAANGLLDQNDPDVKAAREGPDSGATRMHPCASIVVKGGP